MPKNRQTMLLTNAPRFVFLGVMAFAVVLTYTWFRHIHLGPDRAVNRIGGYSLLGKISDPVESDVDFFESLTFPHESSKENPARTGNSNNPATPPKSDPLALVNIQINSGADSRAVINQLDALRDLPSTYIEGCPAKFEISALALAARLSKYNSASGNLSSSEQEFISKLFSKVTGPTNGYRIYTHECRTLFAQRPYLAQAYMFYLASFATEIDDAPSAMWSEILTFPNLKRFYHFAP